MTDDTETPSNSTPPPMPPGFSDSPKPEKPRWQDQIKGTATGLRAKIVKILPQDLARSLPKSWEPVAWADWVNRAFQKRGATFYGKLATVLLSSFFLADVTALVISKYIPDPPLVRGSRTDFNRKRTKSIEDYSAIFARNLFNSQGLIPGDENTGVQDLGGAPIRTSLPFNLVGTMILRDELRSIATIEDRSANMVYPVREQDEIPSKAKILKIEAHRVVFLNQASGRREFVELPQDLSVTNPRISLGVSKSAGPGIEQVSPTQFNISRTEVDNALKDLNQILTQARCIPNFENNLPSGFKCFQIVPGSIYDKLGMKNGDVICGINGESINDVGKAFGLLEQLKTQSHIDLCLQRDGKKQQMAYDIH